MWKIIAMEIRYHQRTLALTYAVSVVFLLFAVTSGLLKRMGSLMSTWSLTSVATSVYIFLLIYIGSSDETEKRERLHALLPRPRPTLGVARVALLVLLQAGFSVIWLIGVMVAGQGFELAFIYYMLSSNAFFCIIVALIAIFLDLGHFGKNLYRGIFAGFGALFVLLSLWLALMGKIVPILESIFLPYTTPAGAAVFVALAAGLFYLDVVIYTRRKSYLQ